MYERVSTTDSNLGMFQASPRNCHSLYSTSVASLLIMWTNSGISSGVTMVCGRPSGLWATTCGDKAGKPSGDLGDPGDLATPGQRQEPWSLT